MDMCKMQPNGYSYFHKGFYMCKNGKYDQALQEVINSACPQDDDVYELNGAAYDNASVFRMGACNLFSLALNQELGLPAYEFYATNGRLIHSFCLSYFNGQPAYVDVRGITTDITEFIEGLQFESGLTLQQQNVANELSMLTEDERIGYEFALSIICQYRGYYTLP